MTAAVGDGLQGRGETRQGIVVLGSGTALEEVGCRGDVRGQGPGRVHDPSRIRERHGGVFGRGRRRGWQRGWGRTGRQAGSEHRRRCRRRRAPLGTGRGMSYRCRQIATGAEGGHGVEDDQHEHDDLAHGEQGAELQPTRTGGGLIRRVPQRADAGHRRGIGTPRSSPESGWWRRAPSCGAHFSSSRAPFVWLVSPRPPPGRTAPGGDRDSRR